MDDQTLVPIPLSTLVEILENSEGFSADSLPPGDYMVNVKTGEATPIIPEDLT